MVARFAAGDAYPEEVDRARALVESCADCALLADDIRLIAACTAELPPVNRTRDFRLTGADAERLRGSWLERFMRGVAVPRRPMLQPLGGAILAIGLALVVVVAIPGIPPISGSATDVEVQAAKSGTPAVGITNVSPAVPEGLPNPPADQAGNAPSSLTPAPPAPAARESTVPSLAPTSAIPPTYGSVPQVDAGSSDEPSPPTGPAGDYGAASPSSRLAASPVPEAEASAAEGFVITSAEASAQPAAAPDQGSVSGKLTDDATRTIAAGAGVLLALLGLGLLAVVWLARRRYADPLQR